MPPLPPGVFEWIFGIFIVVVILGVVVMLFKFLYPRVSGFAASTLPNKELEGAINQMIEEIEKLRKEIEELKEELKE